MTARTRSRVYLYPEEILYSGPESVAELVQELGFGGVSVALTYHRSRRVLPRIGRVSTLLGGGLAFVPERERYADLVPLGDRWSTTDIDGGPGSGVDVDVDMGVGVDAVAGPLELGLLEFARQCRVRGLGFGVWLVALSVDDLVRAHPDLASRTADGGWHGGGLCPSHPRCVRYVADLVADVCRRFAPDLVDLEAALYPGWEPGFTLTLGPGAVPADVGCLSAQCFCDSCLEVARRIGIDGLTLRATVRDAAAGGWDGAETAPSVSLERLAALRTAGAGTMLRAASRAATQCGDTLLRVLGFGTPAALELQGLRAALTTADTTIGVGYGALAGAALRERAAQVRQMLLGRVPAASVNWAPERDLESFAADVAGLVRSGAEAVSVYNLSLAPSRALPAFRAVAAQAASQRAGERTEGDW